MRPPAVIGARARAELYRALHVGTEGDVAFYLAACAGAGRVLELGCGAGRVLAPLAEAGHEVVGVDRDAASLTLADEALTGAARERVTLVEADMSDLGELDLGRFDRVLIPFTGLYALDGLDAMARCLAGARAHLAPGGVLALDAYAVDHAECGPREPWDSGWETLGTITWRDQEITVAERNVAPGPPCRVDVFYRFELPEGPVEQSIRHHFLSWEMLDELLDAAGFGQADVRGGFDGEPYDDGAELMVVVAAP